MVYGYNKVNTASQVPEISPKSEVFKGSAQSKVDNNFALALAEKMGIHFSKHAADRLRFRKIQLTQMDVMKLKDGIDRLDAKAVKQGVVVTSKLVYVVGVPTRTVITVKIPPYSKGGVFSQIDGVVFVE